MSTTTSGYRFSRVREEPSECSDPQKREFLALIGVVKRTSRRVALNFDRNTNPDETSAEALASFARELGLEDHIRQARRDLADHIKKTSNDNTLRTMRLRVGLSQQELAEMVGTSQSRISAIEARREGMGLGFAHRLSKVLGVTLEAIFEATEGATGD